MAQRSKTTKSSKSRQRTGAPRRVGSRRNQGRKSASGRSQRVNLTPEYQESHGVDLVMPDPKRWRFKEDVNTSEHLRFHFEQIPSRRKAPVWLHFSTCEASRSTKLRSFAEYRLGKDVFAGQPGIEGRFRGMPALIVDQNVSVRKLGFSHDDRVIERVIFFRSKGRICTVEIWVPPSELRVQQMELDEVLSGITVGS
jgi:hypothetical protein